MTTSTGYSRTQIILHWITAIAVLVAWFTHDAMEDVAKAVWDAGAAPYPTVHTFAGVIAFFTILIRLWLRRRHGVPEQQGSAFNQMAAEWGHRALYLLVIVVPLLGSLTWFVDIRDLAPIHEYAAKALMLLALGHAAMAIWHQFIKKDGTLSRMWRAG